MSRTQTLSFAIRNRPLPLHRSSSRPHPTFFQPYHPQSKSRQFTNRTSLFILSRPSGRPQLPFLHPASKLSRRHNQQTLLARFITTERKRRWKHQLRYQLRFHGTVIPIVLLGCLLYVGVRQTEMERDYPTPREWTFWSRWDLRTARYNEFDARSRIARVLVDWNEAARMYYGCLQRLEDPAYDGKDLIVQEGEGGGELLVDGLGKTGYDITAKSEPWRRGYHECLMGCARVAENLEGMAKTKGDPYLKKVVSWEHIVGPSNPRPKPMPWQKDGGHLKPPKEEDMEDAFPKPELFYMKILTTNGFTPRQRLDAAIGYADYLDFKGMFETADAMYDWALDIAAGGLPEGANDVVDIMTGVINPGKDEWVSENILRASTAMGVHNARKGDVKAALPIFLSVLRSRRNLPAALEGSRSDSTGRKNTDIGPVWQAIEAVKKFLVEAPYPAPPSSGNERPHHTLKEACEEVGIMTYIGEILFATSTNEREKGLSWTRDSVGAAEAVLWVMDERGEEDTEGKQRCRECLETGLGNWKKMAQQMVGAAKLKVAEHEQSKGWLGTGIGKDSAVAKAVGDVNKWKEEEAQIDLHIQKTASLVHPLKPIPKALLSA